MAHPEVIDDLAAAEALAPAWDELAQGASLPLCAPGWMLSWWRHMAPSGSELRIIAVRDSERLIGLAPWFADPGPRGRTDVRFLGAEISDRVDVLCRPGREQEVASALRAALGELRPRPDLIAFEAVPANSQWTRRLARRGLKLTTYRNSVLPAPTVTLPAGEPEAWLAGRSNHFRKRVRRLHRQLEALGGTVRQASDADERLGMLETMLTLHRERWSERGESGLTRQGVPELLHDACEVLGPDRMRLWLIEIDGTPISVQLFLAAGTALKYWNGGWAEGHAELQPTMLTILAAIEDAAGRGERRLDLGAGTHPYKMRFADGDDPLSWGGLIVRNRRWPATRAELGPRVLRYRAKQLLGALPDGVDERLRSLAARGRGERPA
jgi:CelD/BcsL family acetyltransferase involved in cellulose biosynthesis